MNINNLNKIQEQLNRLNILNIGQKNKNQLSKYLFSSYNINNSSSSSDEQQIGLNIFDEKLKPCGTDPMTGFLRDGYCKMTPYDYGFHVVCAKMTSKFLQYSKKSGNDLSTPTENFPGLKPGDKWCICAPRYRQAVLDHNAPQVDAEATDKIALKFVHRKQFLRDNQYNLNQTIRVLDESL